MMKILTKHIVLDLKDRNRTYKGLTREERLFVFSDSDAPTKLLTQLFSVGCSPDEAFLLALNAHTPFEVLTALYPDPDPLTNFALKLRAASVVEVRRVLAEVEGRYGSPKHSTFRSLVDITRRCLVIAEADALLSE